MSTKAAHTPLPWTITDVGHTNEITGELGQGVKYTLGYVLFNGSFDLKRANAELITNAVNHHQELLTRLYNLRNTIDAAAIRDNTILPADVMAAMKDADETLKKVIQ